MAGFDDMAERALRGEVLVRQKLFEEMMRVYTSNRADLKSLIEQAKHCMPKDIEVKFLIDSEEDEAFITATRWEAAIAAQHDEDGKSQFLMWFEDSSMAFGLPFGPQWKRSINEKNIVLTAIEKAFLLIDPKTQLNTRFASARAREVVIGRKKDDGTFIFKPTQAIEWVQGAAIDKAVDMGISALDNMLASTKNKAYIESGSAELPLIIMYSGTPALPEECAEASREALVEMGFSADAISPLGYVEGSMTLQGAAKHVNELVDKGLAQVGLDQEDVSRMLKQASESIAANVAEIRGGVATPQDDSSAAAPRFCRHCGNRLGVGAQFCGRCGNRVER